VSESAFRTILHYVADVSAWAPEEIVFIGGIAVYLHAVNHPATEGLAEATRDVDFYVSLGAFSDLREMEEMVSNRRLSKHEFKRADVSFDVYVERSAALPVPYDEAAAHAVSYDGIRVACVEHLVVLKLRAYANRKESAHGAKDARDLLRMACLVHHANVPFDGGKVAAYCDDADTDLLQGVARGSGPIEMAAGNAQKAKQIRAAMVAMIAAIETAGHKPPAP